MLAKLGYILGGIAIVVLSFGATMYMMDRWGPPASSGPTTTTSTTPSPQATGTQLVEATAAGSLPVPTTPGFSWAGIGGLNARVQSGMPVVSGQKILQLIAVPTDGAHTVAPQFTGLNKGQTYRITAWVKPLAGANIAIGASDLAEANPNSGLALFDLAGGKVSSGSGAVKPGIAQDSAGWSKVWVDLPTSTGQFIINLYVAKGGESSFKGDGKLGLMLGGLAADSL